MGEKSERVGSVVGVGKVNVFFSNWHRSAFEQHLNGPDHAAVRPERLFAKQDVISCAEVRT